MADLERIDGNTKLFGLLASPCAHSISPAMHNLSFQKLGLNCVYMAFDVGDDQLADVVTGLRALNVRGFNVSMPNKTKILPLLDELSPAARFSGAVNTVVNEGGKFIGYNTDGIGYMRSLVEAGVDIIGKKMTIIGAGGAATAIAIQAALDGAAEITIFNRHDAAFPRAELNAEIINKNTHCKAAAYSLEDSQQLRDEIANSYILTNATSVGMNPLDGQSLISDISWLHSDLIASDVLYKPKKSRFLEQAESAGCTIINGLGMVLWQGAKAFEIWTGLKMPVEFVKLQLGF